MEKQQASVTIVWVALSLLVQSSLMAASPTNPVAAQYQFAGGAQMVGPNMAKLKQIGALPSTATFRAEVVRKMAATLSESFAKQLNAASGDAVPLLTPMLNDLLQAESVAAFGGRAGAPLGFALAIHLDDAHAKVWQENLGRILASSPEKLTVGDFSGLVWKKAGFRLIRAKEWLVVSRGDDLLPKQNEFLQAVAQRGRPVKALQDNWLEADADWPRLASWLPLSSCPFKLARTEIAISARNDNQRTTVHIQYPESIQWKSKPWRVPLETIHDPLVSFTAMQNVAPFLKPDKELSQLKVNPLAEQCYVWALRDVPFQTYAAVPVDHASDVLRDLAAQLPAVYNPKLKEARSGQFTLTTNHASVIWQGLPFIVPTLSAKKEKAGEFLDVSFFPSPNKGQPAPSELLGQFTTRTNLVYYDWELTEVRLQQWRPMVMMLPILRPGLPGKPAQAKVPQPQAAAQASKTNSPSLSAREQWLTAVAPLLGNCVTEVTATGPNNLTLVRKSHLGFTGLELVMLSHWFTDSSHLTPYMPFPRPVADKVQK